MQAGFLIPQFQNISSSECLGSQKGVNGLGTSVSEQETGSCAVDKDFLAVLLGITKDGESSHSGQSDHSIFACHNHKDTSIAKNPLMATDEVDSTLLPQEGEKEAVLLSEVTGEDQSNLNPVVQVPEQATQKAPVDPAIESKSENPLLKQEDTQLNTDAAASKGLKDLSENIELTSPVKEDLVKNAAKTNIDPHLPHQSTQKTHPVPAHENNGQDPFLKREGIQCITNTSSPKGTEQTAVNTRTMSFLKEDLAENTGTTNISVRDSANGTYKTTTSPGPELSASNSFSKPEHEPFGNHLEGMKGAERKTKNIPSPPPAKEHVENACKSNIPAHGLERTGEKADVIQKNPGVNFGSTDGDLSVAKAVRVDSDSGGSGLQSSNEQASDKLQVPHMYGKETETAQKSFQNDTLNQIVSKAALNIKKGYSEIKIDLKPEVLGRLRMQISTENHQVLVKMMTDAPLAREIIENNVQQLKTALQSHGLEIDKFEVTVDQDANQNHGGYKSPSFQETKGEFKKGLDAEPIITEERENPLPLSDKGTKDIHVDFFA